MMMFMGLRIPAAVFFIFVMIIVFMGVSFGRVRMFTGDVCNYRIRLGLGGEVSHKNGQTNNDGRN